MFIGIVQSYTVNKRWTFAALKLVLMVRRGQSLWLQQGVQMYRSLTTSVDTLQMYLNLAADLQDSSLIEKKT